MVITTSLSNHTLYACKTKAERCVLITWSSLALTVNLVGNLVILLAIRRKAITLDKVSVTLIQNIAVSDILMALSTILPTLVSLIADRWVFGDTVCYIQHYLYPLVFTSALLLICALHVSKLVCLAFPLWSIGWSKRAANCIAVVIWIIACIIPIVQLCVDKTSVTFDYRLYRCHFVHRAPVWRWFHPLLMACIIGIPNFIVFVTTIALLIFVHRKRGTVTVQGALTSLYIGLAYLLSFGPHAINQTIITKLYPTMNRSTQGFFFVFYTRFAFFIPFLNGMSNFFIYMISLKSFGEFVEKLILGPLRTKLGSTRTSVRVILSGIAEDNDATVAQ